MAKIKFGHIVVDASGKVGGTVFSKNKGGNYMRAWAKPINPETVYQVGVRNMIKNISQSWRALTEAQRLAWNSAVNSFKKTDVLGDLRTPSGFNLYGRLNKNLLDIGESVVSDPPIPTSADGLTSLSAATAAGAGTATLTFAPAIAATVKMKLFATPPVSPGKKFVKSEYRQIGTMASTDVSPFSAETLYDAKFGSVGTAGQKIFFKMVPVAIASGNSGIGLSASAITGA